MGTPPTPFAFPGHGTQTFTYQKRQKTTKPNSSRVYMKKTANFEQMCEMKNFLRALFAEKEPLKCKIDIIEYRGKFAVRQFGYFNGHDKPMVFCKEDVQLNKEHAKPAWEYLNIKATPESSMFLHAEYPNDNCLYDNIDTAKAVAAMAADLYDRWLYWFEEKKQYESNEADKKADAENATIVERIRR
jgi:hypothetical protein